jgi:hypothetical protein
MIQAPSVPNLPLPKDEYSKLYLGQLTNVLRLYFNQLNDVVSQLTQYGTGAGGAGIAFPYGAFSSSSTQTAAANTATALTYNSNDFVNGVSVVSNSKITVANAGIYNLQFSVQAQNSDNQLHDMSIWLRQNGTDIVGSTGFISIPNKHGSADGHGIYGWNYYVSMNAGDHIEIWWSTDSTQVTIPFYAASTGPVRPSTQSVVATLSFVSAL